MDWLGRSYSRLLASDAATTLLREDEAFNQKPENTNSQNLLLKGDNLEILKHLSHAYHEKVKMIYIDPPYNTGGDGFVYQDDRKFTVKELQRLAGVTEEKAKRILEFTMSKSNSHSAWLTFMYPRLYIAKQLLKDDGVIFVSIDDNEVAQLRLLMDEVFGEENFVAEFVWEKIHSVKNDAKYVSDNHEYVLCWSKNKSEVVINLMSRTAKMDSAYTNIDDDPRGPWASGDLVANEERKEGSFEVNSPITGKVFNVPSGKHWVVSKANLLEMIRDNRVYFGRDGNAFPRKKRFLSEVQQGLKPSTLLGCKDFGHNQEAKRELKALIGGELIAKHTPKPIRLISHLIRLGSGENDLIMDFFAGTGTTGDSILRLNCASNANRSYILVQLPEVVFDQDKISSYVELKNELGIEEPTIFEITKERLIRAANKLREERPVEVAGKDLGFKVFETIPLWEDYHHKAETLEEDTPPPFRGDLLGVDDLQALFITWKTHDGSPLTETAVDYDLGGYMGKYVNERLYLMEKNFTTDHLVTLLQKVDADADFNPRAVIVFESNFQSKNLRELSESLKNFQNQKSLEIDFIMRF
ncbi:MAG: hypothetical protein CAK88_06725 [Verrucomicrobiia bacterium AMD-G2]|nr:MAG: hypothetical protein CAK88_06725 [Verrucomicrobiae bacterium AMD-G2]